MTINQLFEIIEDLAQQKKLEVYPVGGYVRDRLLSLNSKDIDFVVIGDGIAFAKALAKILKSKHLIIYKTFGTAHISFENLELEFVAARKESYRSDSRKPIVETGTLDDDLSRRDFTINSMAMRISKDKFGEIIDPYNGQKDLRDKIIRTPLSPDIAFTDDPLRILRAVRFAARFKYDIETRTSAAIQNFVERLDIISEERIFEELKKMLEHNNADMAIKLLKDSGITNYVIPEIEPFIDQISSAFTLSAKKSYSINFQLMIATSIAQLEKHQIEQICLRLKTSNELKQQLEFSAYYFESTRGLLLEEKLDQTELNHYLYQTGKHYQSFMEMVALILDSQYQKHFKGKHIAKLEEIDSQLHLSDFKLSFNGNDIQSKLNVKGQSIGRVKDYLTEQVLNNVIANTFDDLNLYITKHQEELLNEIA